MTGEELYESMIGLDDELLEHSEKAAATGRKIRKVLLPLAACFGVALLSAALLERGWFAAEPVETKAPTPTQATLLPTEAAPMPTQSALQSTGPATAVTEPPEETVPPIPPDSWEVVYNEGSDRMQAMIAAPFGYFREEMSREQLKFLLPDALQRREDIRGTAHYKAGNELWYVSISVPVGDYFVTVLFEQHPSCILGKPEGVTSVCGNVEYYVMEWMLEKKIKKSKYVPTETPGVYMLEEIDTGLVELVPEQLEAEATINGVPMFFLMPVNIKYSNGDAEKQAFKEVLTAFATYSEGLPACGKLTPLVPRNSFYYDYSLEEARKDETFGSYLPQQIPEKWEILSVRRYYEEESYVNKLEMEVITEEHGRMSWEISEASPVNAQPQSQEKITRLMAQRGRVDLNCGGVAVRVLNRYPENEIDCQWLYEQLAALPVKTQPVKPVICTGSARVEHQRYLEVR